jgi:Galactose oxidase, central domain
MMNSRRLEERLGAYFQHDRSLLPPDALVLRVLEIPVTHPPASAPASRLWPGALPHGATRQRLTLVLVVALLLIVALASAIAIGQSLPITVEELPPPNVRGEFQPTGMLPRGASPQALVSQADGSALLVGGQVILRFDPGTGLFAGAGRLQIPRTLPATVVLDDGRVLIVGGGRDLIMHEPRPAEGYRAEIYDPATQETHFTAPTVRARAWGSATLLDDGRVLVAGGGAGGFAVATAEIFDPATEEFVETRSMLRPRSGHAAVRLNDGRVLLIGGAGSDTGPDAELFDPVTGRFSAAAPMPLAPSGSFGGGQNAALLPDGRVLILEAVGEGARLRTPIQCYDPATDEFTLGPSMPSPRQAHRIALLDDGRVLIVGGWGRDAPGQANDAYIYDPAAEAIVATDSLNDPRLAPFVATLSDGRVLVVGSQCWNDGCYGLDAIADAADRAISAEIFD